MVGSPAEPHSVAGIVVGLRRSQRHATAFAWEFAIGIGWSGVTFKRVALGRSPKDNPHKKKEKNTGFIFI